MHHRKQQSLLKKEETYATKRADNMAREQRIWAADSAVEQRTEAKYEVARSAGTGARRNQSGQTVNIVTLSPVAAPSSRETAALDRQQQRAVHLYSKAHSVSHNIITGEPLKLPAPVKPQY
ncbi:hypothetical protein GPECTOR_23g150 [Gonium pectorale]|uniref:Uncharacterized protein n=1 Tax=Gonium pectorale TaxID=33097 RepID=A0A150GHG9_GONPE|nr:hypothetical protein GPECTOR_23g150 [Gonium pectorale]|eukprot:KXZ49065.1 hypothetical protein GPECTOR_23g150 [Gonium pectorale]